MSTSISPHSLRERKKDDTRRALTEAAYQLTLERGFDGFTVAEVADGAGVSRRTFSNYFTGKAECVMAAGEVYAERAVAQLIDADPAEPIDQLIRRVLRTVAAEIDGEWGDMLQIAQLHPELRAECLVNDQRLAGMIAEALAHRLGIQASDVAAQALGLFAITASRVAVDQWVDSGRRDGRDGLTALLERVFLLLDSAALDALRRH